MPGSASTLADRDQDQCNHEDVLHCIFGQGKLDVKALYYVEHLCSSSCYSYAPANFPSQQAYITKAIAPTTRAPTIATFAPSPDASLEPVGVALALAFVALEAVMLAVADALALAVPVVIEVVLEELASSVPPTGPWDVGSTEVLPFDAA